MLTLCQFVDKQTVKVLAGPTPDNMVPLIDINRNIAAGLMNLPERDSEAKAPVAEEPAEDQPKISIDTEA